MNEKPMTTKFTPKWLAALITIFVMTYQPASAQDKATLDSSWKIKNSSYYGIILRIDSCNTIEAKWNSHCWKCKDSVIPEKWYVLTIRNKTFIKPEL
jgi:hypothetical protein